MPDKTFLAYQLRSCSHPFPFKSLRYRASGSRRGPPQGESTTATSQSSHGRQSAQDARDQQLVERESTSKLSGAQKQVRAPVRFPDLIRKFVRRETAEVAGEEAVRHATSSGSEVKEVALGEPGTDNRVRSVELSVVMDPNNPLHRPPPDFLREVSVELSTMLGLNIALLTRSDDDGWTIPVPIVADDDGVIEPRLVMRDSSGVHPRLRRMAALAVTKGDESVSIVMIEDTELWWRLYGQVVDDEACQRLFQHGAADFSSGGNTEPDSIREVLAWAFSD